MAPDLNEPDDGHHRAEIPEPSGQEVGAQTRRPDDEKGDAREQEQRYQGLQRAQTKVYARSIRANVDGSSVRARA